MIKVKFMSCLFLFCGVILVIARQMSDGERKCHVCQDDWLVMSIFGFIES